MSYTTNLSKITYRTQKMSHIFNHSEVSISARAIRCCSPELSYASHDGCTAGCSTS